MYMHRSIEIMYLKISCRKLKKNLNRHLAVHIIPKMQPFAILTPLCYSIYLSMWIYLGSSWYIRTLTNVSSSTVLYAAVPYSSWLEYWPIQKWRSYNSPWSKLMHCKHSRVVPEMRKQMWYEYISSSGFNVSKAMHQFSLHFSILKYKMCRVSSLYTHYSQ